jgi:hypothetical protein
MRQLTISIGIDAAERMVAVGPLAYPQRVTSSRERRKRNPREHSWWFGVRAADTSPKNESPVRGAT